VVAGRTGGAGGTGAPHVRTTVDGHVLTVTLDRPDRLNAFTGRMAAEMIAAFDRADADDEVRAVVVTGAGRAFCAGADLAAGASTFDHVDRAAREPAEPGPAADPGRDTGGLVALRIFECTKPVIAAINGPAVGIGATMTLPMDVRLASATARIGFVFTRRGIVPEAASSWFLPRVVGISRALEWVTTGRVFDAAEALDGGLVRSVHPPDELLPAAYALAAEIAQNAAPVSVALARQMMWRMLGADHPMEAHRVDSRAMTERGRSADAAEGVTAFLDKRVPRFPDRVSADMPAWYPWWRDRPWTPPSDRDDPRPSG
jgi:enoyl-CoA hydratase/carnithine racemase